MSLITMGVIASTLAGSATGVGALPALIFENVSDKILNSMLGGAVGVMLATFGVMTGFVIMMAMDNLLG